MSQRELLRDAIAMLNEAGIPFMIVGSYASAFHGEPRMTRDIDMVVEPTAASLQMLVDRVDRERFYLGDALSALRNRDMFNMIEPSSGWKIDFVIRKDRRFSEVEFERRIAAEVQGVAAYIATAEDTVLAKLEWGAASGSPRQFDDVVAILAHGEPDHDYLKHWATELGVEWALKAALTQARGGSESSSGS